jgi:hypothetical protein
MDKHEVDVLQTASDLYHMRQGIALIPHSYRPGAIKKLS